jgi:hypothetical protein
MHRALTLLAGTVVIPELQLHTKFTFPALPAFTPITVIPETVKKVLRSV